MERVLEKGRTLLVDGPACMVLNTGIVNVLGAVIKVGEKIVVREGKRLPFEAERRATLNITINENTNLVEVDGNTTPPSWLYAVKEILSLKRPLTIAVIGGVDSGKTSFCVYLANKALKSSCNVAVIDADLGQSDIGPPSTIGYSRVTKPVKDLFELEVENAFFVGLTSPSRGWKKVLEGLTNLKIEVSKNDVDFLIVNTDGWISGEEGRKYKTQLMEKIVPDVLVGIQLDEELTPIFAVLEAWKIMTFAIESPKVIRKRSQEKRKILRELSYKKYLKGSKTRLFPLNKIKLTEKIEIIKRSFKSPSYFKERREEGFLVALQGEQGNFLGIGVLLPSLGRGAVKVYTPVNGEVSTIQIGEIMLDINGRESD